MSNYIRRYAVVPGKQLVVMTTNDGAYQAALDWYDAGREVVAIVDTRSEAAPRSVLQRGREASTVIQGSAVINVKGHQASQRAPRSRPSILLPRRCPGAIEHLKCDTIASSGGWSPVVHLSCHTGSRPVWNDEVIGFFPGIATKSS